MLVGLGGGMWEGARLPWPLTLQAQTALASILFCPSPCRRCGGNTDSCSTQRPLERCA